MTDLFSWNTYLYLYTAGCWNEPSYFVKMIWWSRWFCNPLWFEAVYCFICGHRRVAVTRYLMICLVLHNTSCIAVVTRLDHPKSVFNRCVIEMFGNVLVLLLICFCWLFSKYKVLCHLNGSGPYFFYPWLSEYTKHIYTQTKVKQHHIFSETLFRKLQNGICG